MKGGPLRRGPLRAGDVQARPLPPDAGGSRPAAPPRHPLIPRRSMCGFLASECAQARLPIPLLPVNESEFLPVRHWYLPGTFFIAMRYRASSCDTRTSCRIHLSVSGRVRCACRCVYTYACFRPAFHLIMRCPRLHACPAHVVPKCWSFPFVIRARHAAVRLPS